MCVECKKELERLINEEYKRRNPDIKFVQNFELSTSFDYFRDNEILYLTIKKVAGYMQKDAGAFDSWALVIKNWVKGISKIVLKWERPEDINNLHYQRFLYRLQKSTTVYNHWLEIDKICKPLLDDLFIKPANQYVVNVPLKDAQKNAQNPEAKIERIFVKCHNDILTTAANMDNKLLYNQLPVGLFKSCIAKANRIFPSSNAMIDIWGLNKGKKELHIFELKEPYENSVGIYSELFFYSMFEKDIINGNFIYKNRNRIKCFRGICDFLNSGHKSIRAHFLATKLHPLIDSEMMNLINKALKKYNIQFDFIRYLIDSNDQKRIVECKIEY